MSDPKYPSVREQLGLKQGQKRVPFERSNRKPAKDDMASGHDRVIKACRGNHNATIVTMNGDEIYGKLLGGDRFTITVESPDCSHGLMIFKHAIESMSFSPINVE